MSYASYKFHKAIRSLALAAGHKREWLASDYVTRILMLNPDDLPEATRCEFRQFQQDMIPPLSRSVKDAHRATVKAMSESEVIKTILRILVLHESIKCHGEQIDSRYNFPLNRNTQNRAA